MATEMETAQVASPARTPRAWNPGQHLAVIGKTGQGKSTLIEWLLRQRRYVMVLKSKPDDVEYQGTELTKSVDSLTKNRQWRWVLEPPYSKQATEFERAYNLAWKEGGWTVDIDELFYHCDQLKLAQPINRLLTQGRSKGISVVSGMQRPNGVTRYAIGESTHVLSFQLEGRDGTILGDAASRRVSQAVQGLQRHEFIWYRQPDFIAVCKLNLDTDSLEWRQISGAE